jgi:hypothetical protein
MIAIQRAYRGGQMRGEGRCSNPSGLAGIAAVSPVIAAAYNAARQGARQPQVRSSFRYPLRLTAPMVAE